uniref:Uncharacterized protein n=1 Tax=Arundo donax TaxID=35708 RepID=A0A0A9AZB9_ARUDO
MEENCGSATYLISGSAFLIVIVSSCYFFFLEISWTMLVFPIANPSEFSCLNGL